jgi:DNA helicase HerA-like ATPase
MSDISPILIGKGSEQRFLLPALGNRHGLVAGATGTGKTVTLQVLAEGFARIGTPVFLADVKGDLAGLSQPISPHPKIDERLASIGIEGFQPSGWPVVAWDALGEQGHAIRTTVSEMGPLLLANLLELNDTQEGVLNIAFRVADNEGLLLLDLEDLQQMLRHIGEQRAALSLKYGNISTASVAAIQRRLLVLEDQGAAHFFGEPALQLADLMAREPDGRGRINVLAADRLIQRPRLYSTILLWLLAELFEELPEVGNPDRPELVFFFDEAHLLFKQAPPALLEQVEQIVRLVRSKGVGVYFITQNPSDVPDEVLGQLGNRIQHALRAYTPNDQKAVRAAADTFRPNPALDTREVITQLGVGEALVSTLDAKGVPAMVDRCLICPPTSRIGPINAAERAALLAASPLKDKYDERLDRESAAELLLERAQQAAAQEQAGEAEGKQASGKKSGRSGNRDNAFEAGLKSAMRSVGTALGREIVRGLAGIFKPTR